MVALVGSKLALVVIAKVVGLVTYYFKVQNLFYVLGHIHLILSSVVAWNYGVFGVQIIKQNLTTRTM